MNDPSAPDPVLLRQSGHYSARRRIKFLGWSTVAVALWLAVTAWASLHKDSGWYRVLSAFWPIPALWFMCLPFWLAWIALPVRSLVVAVLRAKEGRWRTASAFLIVPTIALAAVLTPEWVSTAYIAWTMRPLYAQAIRYALASDCTHYGNVYVDSIDCDEPPIAVFPWFGFGSITQGVVFDGTDEIGRQPAQRSDRWRNRRTGAQLQCAMAEPLGDHYYRFIDWGLELKNGICG